MPGVPETGSAGDESMLVMPMPESIAKIRGTIGNDLLVLTGTLTQTLRPGKFRIE